MACGLLQTLTPLPAQEPMLKKQHGSEQVGICLQAILPLSLANGFFIGYCGLGRAVNSLGLRTSAPIELDFIVGFPSRPGNNTHMVLTSPNSAPPSAHSTTASPQPSTTPARGTQG